MRRRTTPVRSSTLSMQQRTPIRMRYRQQGRAPRVSGQSSLERLFQDSRCWRQSEKTRRILIMHLRMAAHAKWTKWKKAADNNFTWREFVNCQSLIVHDKHCHGQGDAHAPHHIRSHDGVTSMVQVWHDLSNGGARTSSHDCGSNRKKLCCSDFVE